MKNSSLTYLICSALIVAMALGCSDDGDTAPNPNENNPQPDASLADTDEPDASQPDAAGPDAAAPDAAVPDAAAPDAEVPPLEGSVAFVLPAEASVYTNDTVEFEVAAAGDAENVELLRDGTEVIASLDQTLTHTWSTLDQDEGSYTIEIRFTVDGQREVHDDPRTIIVDRTPPLLETWTPDDGAENVKASAPIVMTFNEPLAPESVTNDTVKLAIGDQDVPYTATLSADGLTITVTFQTNLAITPYDATLELVGVTDLAGNSLSQEVASWTVPAWIKETTLAPSALNLSHDFRVFGIGGTDYLVARKVSAATGQVLVLKAEDGVWTQVANSADYPALPAIDAAVLDDEIFISIVYNADLPNSQVERRLRILRFDPVNDSLTVQEGAISMGTATGNVGVSLALTNDLGLAAVVSNGVLRIYEFIDENLVNNPVNGSQIAATDYPNVRDAKIKAHIGRGSVREVVFAQCASNAVPCPATGIRHITKGALPGWTLQTGTFASPAYGSCDTLNGFDVHFPGTVPVGILSYPDSCENGGPRIYGKNGAGFADSYFAVVNLNNLGGVNDTMAKYRVNMAEKGGNFDVLLTSGERLELMHAEAGLFEWVRSLDTGLNTSFSKYAAPGLFRTSNGLIVVFRHTVNTHIYRLNE